MKEEKSLNSMLGIIHVDVVDDYHNEVNDGTLPGILGWYSVADETGVIAYFATEREALAYRLCLVNRRLNPVEG